VIINNDKTIEKNIEENVQISALGNTMKNNIEEIIGEYGNALNEKEKVKILLEIMKQYL